MISKRQILKTLAIAGLSIAASSLTYAATPFPTKTVRLVVPYAAGGCRRYRRRP